MSWRAVLRLAAAVVLAVVATAGRASALPQPSVPPDVAAAFSGDALEWVQRVAPSDGTYLSGDVRVGEVHEVFWFSTDFVEGTSTDEPVRPSGSWLAGLLRGDEVLGTIAVWKPEGGPAQPNGYSDDVPIGSALGTMDATELLVVDEPNGAYYALQGSTVRPLNDWAREYLPEAGDISRLQDPVAARYTELRNQSAEPAPRPGLPIALSAMAVTLAVGIGIVLARRLRLRQDAG
jgi:hypothetical protein